MTEGAAGVVDRPALEMTLILLSGISWGGLGIFQSRKRDKAIKREVGIGILKGF